MITDARNIAILMYLILIGSWEGIYLRHKTEQNRRERKYEKGKIYFILKQVLSDTSALKLPGNRQLLPKIYFL